MAAAPIENAPEASLVEKKASTEIPKGSPQMEKIPNQDDIPVEVEFKGVNLELNHDDNDNEYQKRYQSVLPSSLLPTDRTNRRNKKRLMTSPESDYRPLPEGYIPSDDDVICSWARQNHSHPGNEKFRIIINLYAAAYLSVSTKYQKSELIAKIVAEVRGKSAGGGFVKKDFYSNRWFEVGDEKARDKVGHAIRKAALALEKKMKAKNQPQSTSKRQIMQGGRNNLHRDFLMGLIDKAVAPEMNHNKSGTHNKMNAMNNINFDTAMPNCSNEMNFGTMNMGSMVFNNMNMRGLNDKPGRATFMGMHNASVMKAMGMNPAGLEMNSITSGMRSNESKEMMALRRLRSEMGSSSVIENSRRGGVFQNGTINSMGLTELDVSNGMQQLPYPGLTRMSSNRSSPFSPNDLNIGNGGNPNLPMGSMEMVSTMEYAGNLEAMNPMENISANNGLMAQLMPGNCDLLHRVTTTDTTKNRIFNPAIPFSGNSILPTHNNIMADQNSDFFGLNDGQSQSDASKQNFSFNNMI